MLICLVRILFLCSDLAHEPVSQRVTTQHSLHTSVHTHRASVLRVSLVLNPLGSVIEQINAYPVHLKKKLNREREREIERAGEDDDACIHVASCIQSTRELC